MNNKRLIEYTDSRKFKITLATLSGLFIFLFLLFFQPFGVNNYRPDEKITPLLILALFIFAAVVILVLLLSEFVIYHWFFPKSRPRHYMVWVILELWLTANATFMVYNVLGGFHDFSFASYFKHLLEIGSILVISFIGIHFYFKHIQVKREFKEVLSVAQDKSKPDGMILLKGDYKNDEIALPLENILFIKSEDNYASIHYLENGTVKRYLIRLTLAKLEKKLTSNTILRINRSILINKTHLESFRNQSGSLKLKLHHIPEPFEVSKSRQSKLLWQLKNPSVSSDPSLKR